VSRTFDLKNKTETTKKAGQIQHASSRHRQGFLLKFSSEPIEGEVRAPGMVSAMV